MSPFLMAVDLDGTMLGDAVALRQLNARLRRRRPFLAYVTGRTLSSAMALLASSELLAPDYLACDVGGSIRYAPAWDTDRFWHRKLSRGWNASRVWALCRVFPQLTPQPCSHQAEHKVSFHLPEASSTSVLPQLRDELRRQRVAARCVYSSGRDLDILPARSGKDRAVAYLAGRLGFEPDQVFVCGDSGNDRDMLNAGFCAAAVANAQPELQAGLAPDVYRCRAAHAAGVEEALRHFGFLPQDGRTGS